MVHQLWSSPLWVVLSNDLRPFMTSVAEDFGKLGQGSAAIEGLAKF